MSTYSVRCRHKACRHRRVTTRHPDAYVRPPKCPMCGHTKGWRLEVRAYNAGTPKNPVCHCSGPDMATGRHFPHRTTHPLCDQNPTGHRNQALQRGVKAHELPLEHMGEPCTTDEAPF